MVVQLEVDCPLDWEEFDVDDAPLLVDLVDLGDVLPHKAIKEPLRNSVSTLVPGLKGGAESRSAPH